MEELDNAVDNRSIAWAQIRFFKQKLSVASTERIRLNSNKNIVKYLSRDLSKTVCLTILDTPLGIMSFSIYYLRLCTNLSLLVELLMREEVDRHSQKEVRKNLYYDICNDLMWSTSNLIQFFWLTSRQSPAAGMMGLQLEVLCQAIDGSW